MNGRDKNIFFGDTPLKDWQKTVKGGYVTLFGESFYKIRNFDGMEPFFMSIVSSSDHWLFVSSSGGLSAGRVNQEHALFPYYTVDKITENTENTGNKAVLLISRPGRRHLWEPFSQCDMGLYRLEHNIYKNITGTTLIFEEINHDLDLTYRYAWRTSERYGFIKTTWLINGASSACEVELVDGLQNLLPANVNPSMQNNFSVLLDAYKRSELEPDTGLGIFALSSIPTDLAEPSECLRATVVAQVGLDQADYLLSSRQLPNFRRGEGISPELEVLGRRAAYFVHATLRLGAGGQHSWHLIADVNKDHAALIQLLSELRTERDRMNDAIERDIAANQAGLHRIVANADGVQLGNSVLSTAHHFSNVLLNVMRGGIFANQYGVGKADFHDFAAVHSPKLLTDQEDFFSRLPSVIQMNALKAEADATQLADLKRLCATYLPLTFSRRHGDPSRPWNRFRINVKKPDGSLRLHYEGNWRDIFQNWEALSWSYPEFVENMLCVFLNATTVDGYNPYRISSAGVDWEQPEPHNPWANIGYWSDHQIIYLQKLMEVSARFHPGALQQWLTRSIFSYANVPYRIHPYRDLLLDSHHTIDFDWDLNAAIEARVRECGTDGKLVTGPDGNIFHATLAEKLLTLLLAKLANFVPEGGIWMNTQRPEWNDANNALVGKGLSVVTLGYLRRFLVFCRELFAQSEQTTMAVRREVAEFYAQVMEILSRFKPLLSGAFSDMQRRAVMDALGEAGSKYREECYAGGISGMMADIPTADISAFLVLAQEFVEHSLRANRRDDHLYHSYNILHMEDGRASIGRLYEMLEGQVSILSSGLLTAEESLLLLESLRHSALYRADHQSYLLYPDRRLPGFLEKNCVSPERVSGLSLVQALDAADDKSLLVRDMEGKYHFSGDIRNIKDVNRSLNTLQNQPEFAPFVTTDAGDIRALFEEVFRHSEFTGRSGTFFAYEGLGSIYWHMVSKLLLAVQETAVRAGNMPDGEMLSQSLAAHYRDIRKGLGYNQPPAVYGAFPTDAYSHSPKEQGARQPGMTGQVKEEILTRPAELGLFVQDGLISFDSFLLDPEEFLKVPSIFAWLDIHGESRTLELPVNSLAYTFCQVPIVVQKSTTSFIEVFVTGGTMQSFPGNTLDTALSRHIFHRDGYIHHVHVHIIMPD